MILGGMEKVERKVRKNFFCVLGWRNFRRENWWGLGVFSPNWGGEKTRLILWNVASACAFVFLPLVKIVTMPN